MHEETKRRMRWQLAAAIAAAASMAIYCAAVGASLGEGTVAVLVIAGVVAVPIVAAGHHRGYVITNSVVAAILAAATVLTLAVGSIALVVPLAAVTLALVAAARARRTRTGARQPNAPGHG